MLVRSRLRVRPLLGLLVRLEAFAHPRALKACFVVFHGCITLSMSGVRGRGFALNGPPADSRSGLEARRRVVTRRLCDPIVCENGAQRWRSDVAKERTKARGLPCVVWTREISRTAPVSTAFPDIFHRQRTVRSSELLPPRDPEASRIMSERVARQAKCPDSINPPAMALFRNG